VLACGLALGPRLGLLSQALYVLLGALGLSVFAEGKSGMATLMGPTGGYLIGFAIAGFVLGMLAEKGWDRSLLKTFLAMQLGHMIILTLGTAWLSVSLGMSKAIQLGFAPFLVGEVAKSLLACLVFPTLRRYV